MKEEIKANEINDGLLNVASGIGTAKSKLARNKWVRGARAYHPTLEAAYQDSWIARRIVDEPARDCVREWRVIKSEYGEAIAQLENDLMLRERMEDALRWSGLYGGAGIIMLTNQDLSKPLDVNKIKKGDLQRLVTIDSKLLIAQEFNTSDVLAENYMQPTYYLVAGGQQRIHYSHIARVFGDKLPLQIALETSGWGASRLQKCLDEISNFTASKAAIAELMHECNIDVITKQDLAEKLTTAEEDKLINRFELFSLMKSTINMALLDGDEKLERHTLSLIGVSQVLEFMVSCVAGAAEMPVTKLFGTSAKGLSATGEGDARAYNDMIRAMQRSRVAPALRTLDQVLVRSAIGQWDPNYDYSFNSVEQIDDEQRARATLTEAQRDQIYLSNGVVNMSQIQRNLQASELYQFDDAAIAELEELERG